MIVPEEFNLLCRMFHQDTMVVHKTLEDAVATAIGSLNETERTVVAQFLEEMLRSQSPLQDIKHALRRSSAEIGFKKDSDLLAFFQLIRETLGRDHKTF